MYVISLTTSMLLGNEHKITDYPLRQWLHDNTMLLIHTMPVSFHI